MLRTEDYQDQIVALFSEGRSIADIQRLLGFRYPQPITNLLKKLGLYSGGTRPTYVANKYETICTLYDEGLTPTQIKESLGLPYVQPVVRCLEREGLRTPKTLDLDISVFREQILELYGLGIPVQKIQTILGVKYEQPIYNLLKKEGVFEAFKFGVEHYRKYSCNYEFFRNIDTEEKAYVLGFILADGHVSEYSVKIALAGKDIDILYKIKSAMESEHPITEYVRKSTFPYGRDSFDFCSLSVNSIELCNDLRALGLSSNKSLTMDGSIVSKIPQELLPHFRRGYFDGDGHLIWGARYSSGTKYTIGIIGTRDFLEKAYADEYGGSWTLERYVSSPMFTWRISAKHAVESFLHDIYDTATIYGNRKASKAEAAQVKPL